MKARALISARVASTRLPNKCFLPFGSLNVLQHVITRANFYGLEPIVCTTEEDADQVIVDLAHSMKVDVFRGESVNRLKRWHDCCTEYSLDAFHTVDADDPFFDGDQVSQSLTLLDGGGFDIISPTIASAAGGASVGYSIKKSFALKIIERTTAEDDTEILAPWIKKIPDVKHVTLPDDTLNRPEARLTLDYEEDYWLLSTIVRILGPFASRQQIEVLLKTNPDLYKINWFRNQEWADRQQSKWVHAEGISS